MKFKRTLIAEQSREYILQIKEMLGNLSEDYECTTDGEKALEIYHRYHPDLILIEAILPGCDAFALLEQAKGDDAAKFVLTSVNHEILIKKAFDCGADFVFVKPYVENVFVARVLEMAQCKGRAPELLQTDESTRFLKTHISILLQRLGIPVSIKGYAVLRDTLLMLCEDFTKIESVSKNIYEPLARRYETTVPCIERNIRHAIETASMRGDPEVFEEYFGYSMSSEKGKPTNREFVAALADKILILKDGSIL